MAGLMDPTLPDDPDLRALAEQVAAHGGRLGLGLHPATLAAIRALLRTVNCYYSNLIEGHDTHPVDIERAMRAEYAAGSRQRDLQLEALAHIAVQEVLETALDEEPGGNVCAPGYLRRIHREFYARLPAALRVVRDAEGSRTEVVEPGALRHFDVRVGDHVAPPHAEVPALLERFARVYDPAGRGVGSGLVTLSAAHHRLLWIHPFGDGNGRVTRLMTELYLRRLGLASAGLWAVARGLARRAADYKRALAAADAERWNDYDGRGPLSLRGLGSFCRFFLEVTLDQVTYMGGILAVDGLAARVTRYGRARETGLLPSVVPGSRAWTADETRLLVDLAYRGTLPRGEVPRLLRRPERTARRAVARLAAEGFLASATSRAPLSIRFPAHAGAYLFPGLYDPQVHGG